MIRCRKKTKFVALGLCLMLAACGAVPVSAAESSAVSKEETVYVMAGQDGTADHIIVSEWLKNAGEKSLIKDYTQLKQIENVKGDETFSQETGTWNARGKDIYYQGNIRKELPVEIKISYYLNGAKVSPKEIAGKSGNVKIRVDYTNSRKQNGVYVPFVLITGMSLDNEIFSNVEVTNGKVINDGQKSMVVGYGLPGLAESLGLSDLDAAIPDYFEVKCQAEKFQMDGTMTLASSGLFNDIDTGNLNSIEDLKAAMDKLESSAEQLQQGAEDLQDGAGSLAEGTGDLYKGTGDLTKGTRQLYSGTKTLKEKIARLGSGLKAAKDGSTQLAGGADQLKEGVGQLETGAGQLEGGIRQAEEGVSAAAAGLQQTIGGDEQVLAGLNQLQAQEDALGFNDAQKAAVNQAIDQMKGALSQTIAGQKDVSQGLSGGQSSMAQLRQGAADLQSGAAKIKENLNTFSVGAKDLNTGITKACEGAGLLEEGAGDLKSGAKQVNDGAGILNAGAGQLKEGAGTLAAGTRDLASGISRFKNQGIDKLVQVFNGDISKIGDRIKALKDAAGEYQSFAGKMAETKGTVKFIYKTGEVK